jgi:hypothetical protein
MNPFVAFTLLIAAAPAATPVDSPSALFARGDFAAAAAAYQARTSTTPSDASDTLVLGAIRLYENNLDAAEPLLRSALVSDPQNAWAKRMSTELSRRRAEAARRTTLSGSESRVPFVTADPLPVVHVVANGTPANFVVDTGGDVELEPEFAQRIGVKSVAAGNGVFAGGRQAPMAAGMLNSLALGTATAYDVPVHVMATHESQLFPQIHVDGIVGTTYFERFLVTMDYPHQQLILRTRSHTVSEQFQMQAVRANASVVPCYLVGDHFVMAQAQVNDAPAGLFLFDSGLAGGGLLPSPELVIAAKIPLDTAHAGTGIGGGGAVTAVPFTASRIAVGTAVQQNVGGLYTPSGSPFRLFPFTVWGAISNDFLRNYAYTVDFDAMKIVLEPETAG